MGMGVLNKSDFERLAANIILRYAQVAAPVAQGPGGGGLRRSLIAANVLAGYGILGFKTGMWTAEGTVEHKIPLQPKGPGRWLKFEWDKMNGDTVFFKQVNHPRYVGTQWTKRAVLAARPEVTAQLVMTGRNVLQYVLA
jgi:hypothetical protein